MLITIYACNVSELDFNDVELPNYNPDFIGPLGSASYSVPELIAELEDDQIDIDTSQAGLLSFVYRDTTTFDDLSQIVILNNVNSNGRVNSPIELSGAAITATIDTTFTEPLEFVYPFDVDEELDSLLFSQGTVTLTYNSSFSVPIDFSLVMNDVTDRTTGEALAISGTVSAGGSGSQSLSLVNKRVVAIQNGSGENVFSGSFIAENIQLNIGDQISPTDFFEFNLSFTDAEFETIYGYFGVKEADIHDQSISFDFFDELEGDISFNEPEVSLTVENAFGMTLGVDLSGISVSNADGQSLALTGSVVDEPQFINGPDINSVGEATTSVVSINVDNSNIRSLFESNPTELFLDIAGQTNFSNIASIVPIEDRNFVDQSSFTVNILEINIPLDVQLSNLTKTFDFGIGEIDLLDTDTIGVRLKSINEIPIAGTFDLQFLASDNTVVHEITDVLAFDSPEVSASGIAQAAKENTTIIPLFGDGIDAFENSPTIRVKMNIESYNASDGQYVKIFYDSEIELIVGLEASLNIEL